RIKCLENPHCAACLGVIESVKHFILECPHYAYERTLFVKNVHHAAYNILFLFSNTSAVPSLLNFVNATKRFHPTLGD
ncbi:hypothetical protein V8E55_003262, partial [Tylopilus felleus]